MSFLERLAGTWHATETLHPSAWNPAGGRAEATLLARLAMGGKALVMEYCREAYEGLGVMLRDGEQYALWWFDALGFLDARYVRLRLPPTPPLWFLGRSATQKTGGRHTLPPLGQEPVPT